MEQNLKLLLGEIDNCYKLGELNLLEREKIENTDSIIREHLENVLVNIDSEILHLKFKKINSGWKNQLKSGFHNLTIAKSKLENWRILIEEILEYNKLSTKTFKNRLEKEGLFIESRSKDNGDLHLLVGQRNGSSEKAHIIIDENNGEIRIEDNQLEPLELVKKIESIITLPNGKKIRVTREFIEEIID